MVNSGPAVRPASLFALVRRFGRDAMSFLAFESSIRHWVAASDGGPDAGVSFADTGSAWIAVGAPFAEASEIPSVARSFVRCARERGRRACFFATEVREIDGFSRLLLGEQPVWDPATWPDCVATHRRLREQIRRPGGKGLVVRRVEARDLEAPSHLRAQIDALAREWLGSRRMAPMGFLVAVEPFHLPEEHRYFVAVQGERVVAFLSAVPVYARRGWLIEDVLRSRRAPNGTTEALIDAMMRDVVDSAFVTLGLAPLSGPVSPWLRLVRLASTPLFEFTGLRRFRQRLHPSRWESVWLQYPRSGWAAVHVADSLRAFAGGSLVGFAVRSVLRGPRGASWALALPLVPWTLLLAGLVLAGRADLLGFSSAALSGWVLYDALLTVLLVLVSLRPRRGRVVASAAAAIVDAGISVPHLVIGGLGRTLGAVTLRSLGAFAPCVGAAVLSWVALQELGRSDTLPT
jgi:phosphatidylglycerol lysyltransferase